MSLHSTLLSSRTSIKRVPHCPKHLGNRIPTFSTRIMLTMYAVAALAVTVFLQIPEAMGRTSWHQSFTGRVALTSGDPVCMQQPNTMWHNGTCNNGITRLQGAANEAFKLLFKPATFDPVANDMPSARLVSNTVCHEEETILNARGVTEFWTYFGQLLDHTVAETHLGKEKMDIPIPANDRFFPPGGELEFFRTVKMETPSGTSPENVLSSYVDASSVYGVPKDLVSSLRLKIDGKLIVSAGGLMPLGGKPGNIQFEAGDARANENPALQAMHTLFVREHNRVCDELRAHFPTWGDEKMYDTARRVVSAEFQAITFYEFVPTILGKLLPAYTGYKKWVDASISNEFATAIYRVGHTLINPEFTLYGKDGKPFKKQLRDTFFKTDVLLEDGIEGVLRGTLNTKAAEVDAKITSQVRNFLTLETPMRVDLAALNIQRGRDHGVPRYNQLRREYGLTAYTDFAQISKDAQVQRSLSDAYGGDIEKIDPWVGGLAEDHRAPGSLGELFSTAWEQEFSRMRDGNRFYFENDKYFGDDLLQKSETVRQLLAEKGKGGTMRRILLKNTKLLAHQVPLHPFRLFSGGEAF